MTRPIDAATGEWTYSEYARLPDDGNRYEVIDGEVRVTPAPTPHHQKVILRLAAMLLGYVEGQGLGWVFQDVDLLFAAGQFLRPDLVVVSADRRAGITDRGVEVPPTLVIEVLSPSSRTIDCVRKPRLYLEFGVPEYWVVDPLEGTIRMWDRVGGPDSPRTEPRLAVWTMAGAGAPLEVAVATLTAPL